MSVKKIVVDKVDAYNIPLTLRDGSDYTLKLREGFTMSNEDADKLMEYGSELFLSIGKNISEAGIDVLLTEDQIEALSDQEKVKYLKMLDKAKGDEAPLTESSVNRKIISFAYDTTDEWLYKNTNNEVLSQIMEHVQGWIGIKNEKKS